MVRTKFGNTFIIVMVGESVEGMHYVSMKYSQLMKNTLCV